MWNQVKTVLLLGALTGLMLGAGQLMGGATGLTIALAFALIMNVGAYFFSDKMVLAMYRAYEAPKSKFPKLHHMVEEIAEKAGLPKPRVYIIPSGTPNAFATGRNPQHAVVACTEGIMELLSERELKGVIAHEVGHIKNRDILITTIAATIAGVISYLASMAQWAAIFGGFGRDRDSGSLLSLLVLAILTPILALILQLAISRSREFLADESAARLTKDPMSLAHALQKLEKGVHARPMRGNSATSSMFIVNPFTAQAFMSLLSTHPSTTKRVQRLERLAKEV